MKNSNRFSFVDIINYGIDNMSAYNDADVERIIEEINKAEADLICFHDYFNKVKRRFSEENKKRKQLSK